MTVMNSLTVNMILDSGSYKENLKSTRKTSDTEFGAMADGAENSGKRVRNSLRTTEQEMMKRSKRILEVVRGFGYQGQDVAIQLAMGTKASTVLSQQGSQLLSMFGPGGAIAGAILSVGTLAYQFISAKTEAGDLNDILKDLDGTITTAKDGTMLFSKEIAELAKRSDSLAKSKMSLLYSEAGEASKKAAKEVSDAVESINTSFDKLPGALDFGEAAAVGVGRKDPWIAQKEGIIEIGEQYRISEVDAKKFADAVSLVQKNASAENMENLANVTADISKTTPEATIEFKKLSMAINENNDVYKTSIERQNFLRDALGKTSEELQTQSEEGEKVRNKNEELARSWEVKARTVGMSALEAAKYNAITANGIDIESAMGQRLSQSITKYYEEKAAIDAANKARDERERLHKKEINRGKTVAEQLLQPTGTQDRYDADLKAMQEYFKAKYNLNQEDLANLKEYKEAEAKIEEEYELKKAQMRIQQNGMMVSSMQRTTSLIQDAFGEQTAVGKAAFFASRALTASQAILAGQAQANSIEMIPSMSWGGIFSQKTAATMARAMGYTNAGIIMGTALMGQAHSGIDDIPREGTWLLDKGERVVDSRTNQDLKNYLAAGGGGGGVDVHVHISPQGNIYGDEQTMKLIETSANRAVTMIAKDAKSNGPIYKLLRR